MNTLETSINLAAMRECARICDVIASNYEKMADAAPHGCLRLEYQDSQIGALKCQSAILRAINSKTESEFSKPLEIRQTTTRLAALPQDMSLPN